MQVKKVSFGCAVGLALKLFVFSVCAGAADPVPITPLAINQWHEIRTSQTPLELSQQPEMLRSIVRRTEPYVSIYTFQLVKGAAYTFQSEYPGDHKIGSACLRGLNPFAPNTSYNYPDGTTPIMFCRNRGFPGGNIKGHLFGRKVNFRVSKKSQHGRAWLVVTSEKPKVTYRIRMIHPAEPDDVIAKSGGYHIIPGLDPIHGWSNVYKDSFWLGYTRGEKNLQISEPSVSVTVPSPPAASMDRIEDMTGSWEFLDDEDKPYVWLTLIQEGNRIRGRARYEKGDAAVEGRIENGHIKISFIYDNPEVLEQWLPKQVSKQVVGIRSSVDLQPEPDSNVLKGTFKGFWVVWDGSYRVKARYDAEQAVANNKSTPRPRWLRRTGEPPVPPAAGKTITGFTLWIEAEDDTGNRMATKSSGEHSSYPHSSRGYWYMASGGDWIEHRFDIPQTGEYTIWLRDFDDSKHPPDRRSVRISIDSVDKGVLSAHTRTDDRLWQWNRAVRTSLNAGSHTLRLTKDRTTSAAALIDCIFIASDGNALPPWPMIATAPIDGTGPTTPAPVTEQQPIEAGDCLDCLKPFLAALKNADYEKARALSSSNFLNAVSAKDFQAFSQQLQQFGNYSMVAGTCYPLDDGQFEAIAVLENENKRTVTVHAAVVNDTIDRCVTRWGIQ